MEQKMEHRMNIRMPVSMPATVYYPGNGGHESCRAMTRNLGFGGACLEAGETPPSKGTIVRLAMDNAGGDPVVIDALVLRNDAEGLGIMFAYYGDDVFQRLASMLQPVSEQHYAHDLR